jgi:peptide/nickel transport system permease protein
VKEFLKRFLRSRSGLGGVCLVLALAGFALAAPILAPGGPNGIDLTAIYRPPSLQHLFGTDSLGRDLFARVVWGTRISLFVGVLAAGIAAVIGVIVGSLSGYFGGKVDIVFMRLVDVMLSIPTFFLILLIALIFGGNELVVALIIGFTIWPNGARLLRGEILKLRDQDFVNAARLAGASGRTIMFSELLPIAIFPLVVDTGLRVGTGVLIEASLAFLGVGDPNAGSLGWLLNEAIDTFRSAWWTGVMPGVVLSLAVVAFNLLADGMNQTLNVRER